jgi:hypothetical protein
MRGLRAFGAELSAGASGAAQRKLHHRGEAAQGWRNRVPSSSAGVSYPGRWSIGGLLQQQSTTLAPRGRPPAIAAPRGCFPSVMLFALRGAANDRGELRPCAR